MWWLDLLTTAAPYFGYGVVGTWVTLANSRYRYAKESSPEVVEKVWEEWNKRNNPHGYESIPYARWDKYSQREYKDWAESKRPKFEADYIADLPKDVAVAAIITGALWPGFALMWGALHTGRGIKSGGGTVLEKLGAYASDPIEGEKRRAKALEDARALVAKHEQDKADAWTAEFMAAQKEKSNDTERSESRRVGPLAKSIDKREVRDPLTGELLGYVVKRADGTFYAHKGSALR